MDKGYIPRGLHQEEWEGRRPVASSMPETVVAVYIYTYLHVDGWENNGNLDQRMRYICAQRH